MKFKTLMLLIGSVFILCSPTTGKNNFVDRQEKTRTIRGTSYKFSIEFKETSLNFPEEIVVKFENNGDSVSLYNFSLQFISKEGSYWGINDDFSFLETPLMLKKDTVFSKTLRLNSFHFKSMKTKEFVSSEVFKENMIANKGFNVVAIIGDLSKARNPYESNLITRSNMIEYKIE